MRIQLFSVKESVGKRQTQDMPTMTTVAVVTGIQRPQNKNPCKQKCQGTGCLCGINPTKHWVHIFRLKLLEKSCNTCLWEHAKSLWLCLGISLVLPRPWEGPN